MFDGLGRDAPLSRTDARAIVRAILDLKYARVSPPGYIDAVVESIRDDPVRLRPLRYHRAEPRRASSADRRESIPSSSTIATTSTMSATGAMSRPRSGSPRS